MDIRDIRFVVSVGKPAQFKSAPTAPQGDVAVVGRSNVGKSSLINFIAAKTVARTSRTPGRTRLINLFAVDERWMLVDLPGYGYASGDSAKRDNETWAPLIEAFIAERSSLRGFLLLIDSRHFPMESDLAASAWMDQIGLPYVVVLTKTDKLNQRERSALSRAARTFVEMRPAARGPVMSSTLDKQGKKEILAAIGELVSQGVALEAPSS